MAKDLGLDAQTPGEIKNPDPSRPGNCQNPGSNPRYQCFSPRATSRKLEIGKPISPEVRDNKNAELFCDATFQTPAPGNHSPAARNPQPPTSVKAEGDAYQKLMEGACSFSPDDSLPLSSMKTVLSHDKKYVRYRGHHFTLKYQGSNFKTFYCRHRNSLNCKCSLKIDLLDGTIEMPNDEHNHACKVKTSKKVLGTPTNASDVTGLQKKRAQEYANVWGMSVPEIVQKIEEETGENGDVQVSLTKQQVSIICIRVCFFIFPAFSQPRFRYLDHFPGL